MSNIDSQMRLLAILCLTVTLTQLIPAHAQPLPSDPVKTGVTTPGVQRKMADLRALATFHVAGNPDWMAVTDDAVWVTSSSANHVVRLDATSNKPDAVITLQKPCSSASNSGRLCS